VAPPAQPAVTVTIGTLATPPWKDLVQFAPDVCVHTAWITDAGVYLQSAENRRYLDESLAFVTGLFERGVGHVVALGTAAEYRPSAEPLHETCSPLEPRSPYARAKHELRLALGERAQLAGTRLTWARVFQPYGFGEPVARICSAVARRLTAGEPVTLDTPNAVRDWIHVDDVATALLRLVEGRVDNVINVGTGVGRTVEQIALTIAGLVGRPELVAVGPAIVDGLGPLVADPARLRGLGWAPRVELEAGLATLIEALR
jgi:dTDP-6-deoxy-L-talose 4-dehydrogenase (NAD+)